MDKDEEKNSTNSARAERLGHALQVSENKRMVRVEQVKAKTGRVDLPIQQRKLTQQEAAAYCGVSPTTIHRWAKDGLKAVTYGKRQRYLAKDLKDYMKNRLKE